MKSSPQAVVRAKAARPLLFSVLLLQTVHVFVLLFRHQPILSSNVVQLLCGVMTVWVCLSQVRFVSEPAGRRCWRAVALAFAIWSLAQACFLLQLWFPGHGNNAFRPDDLLWTLFGLPLLLAVNTFTEETIDRVLWMDRLQGVLFFVVIYLAVFLPSVRLNIGRSFLIQDVALLLSSLLRLPTAATDRERRFFLRLSLFLGVYAPSTLAGDVLHYRGYLPGGLVDLVWTVPFTFFCVLVLWHAIRPWNLTGRGRVVSAVRNLQGLSASVLALLSVCLSAYVAVKDPIPGGICIALTFGIFALRTNAREVAWYTAHGQLEHAVLQDSLTGLGNRMLLGKELSQRSGKREKDLVLLFADLDRFKSINDTFGHALGDLLLIEIGQRLCTAAPPNSVVCRLGGDEFVVLTTASSAAEAQSAGERLRDALHAPFHLGRHLLRCTASIGVVLAGAGKKPDDLLRTADHAMYRAKQLGKDRVQLFDADLSAQLSSRWHMEAELRATVEAGTIQVAFQPIYSVEKDGVCGFEALARWSHPVLGNVAPVEFIALAEESGLILSLGAQVLEKACAQIASWNADWGTCLSVSVNVSPRQFAHPGLIDSLLAILKRTGLPPSLLRLEITETALLTQVDIVKQTLEQARAHGIRISLDDFGTGYSSLSFLLSLPVDEVKVDRSFVSNMHSDPDREEVVRTVIRLGQSLGKRVVAEGVETEQDLRGLTEMGCECVQGYLIGKPLFADAIGGDFANIAARRRTAPGVTAPSLAGPTSLQGARTLQDGSEILAGIFCSKL